MDKLGVIIANTGTPDEPTPEAVRTYLSEFLTDPRICPMNPVVWRLILNVFILPKRSEASAQKYMTIWTDEGSPLDVHMRSLARKLEDSMKGSEGSQDVMVRYAMSYGNPSISAALQELRAAGCSSLLVIPLYPQSAYSTTNVVLDKVADALAKADWKPRLTVIDEYSANQKYLDAIAHTIEASGFREDDILLMAFHSIPMSDVRAGDTYVDQVNATSQEVAKRLGLSGESWKVGYQCRFDNRKWVGPSTHKVLADIEDGRRLFVVTPNFSIDCLETLHEIEHLLKPEALAEGISDVVYIPCLNDSDAHVEVLKDLIESNRP